MSTATLSPVAPTTTDALDAERLLVLPDAVQPARLPPRAPKDQPTETASAFGVILRGAGLGMLAGLLAFAAFAVVLLLVTPDLAGFGFGAAMVFIALSAGFGAVPGLIVGIGQAEDALGH